MIIFTANELAGWLAQLFWPFLRIGACLMIAPAFGATSVPPRVRVVLAGALALLIAPLLPPSPPVTPFSGEGCVIAAQQLLIGGALGFCLQLLFDAVSLGGQLLANSMGLSFAFNLDPLHGGSSSTPALGQLYSLLVTLTFLALNGHLTLIETLVRSFASLPVGASGLGANGLQAVVAWGAELFNGALAIALPGVTALLIVNLAFGVISRAAPALNLFAVGLPIALVFGLAIVLCGLPVAQATFVQLLEQAFAMLRWLVGLPE